MLYIGGKKVASPSVFEVGVEDRGDFSMCNVLGQRLADRLAVKRVIDVEWAQLSPEGLADIMNAVTENVFFEVEYPDPVTGERRAAVCRAVEKNVRMHRLDGGAPVWTQLRMRWEER